MTLPATWFKKTNAPGQVLLTTLLLLSTFTMGFALLGVLTQIQENHIQIVIEQKSVATAAATGCAEQAMDRLGRNASYSGDETMTLGLVTCTIRPILMGGGIWTIETWSSVGDATARERVILTQRSPVRIGSWLEVAAF